METIRSVTDLENLYPAAVPRSLAKVVTRITPLYREWIEASRFLVLTTVGPEGTDGSPRGDDGPVVRIADETTLLLPDWRGNNRLDSLRNIVRDGRVSLMFMVAGSTNVVRVNGEAVLTADTGLRAGFSRAGKVPTTVVVVTIRELYFQCAKSIIRSRLWSGERVDVPSAGDFVKEVDRDFDGAAYDADYPDYARERMW